MEIHVVSSEPLLHYVITVMMIVCTKRELETTAAHHFKCYFKVLYFCLKDLPGQASLEVVCMTLNQIIKAVYLCAEVGLKLVPTDVDHLTSNVFLDDFSKMLHFVSPQLQLSQLSRGPG